ncbi:2-dehydropantoate 2-reductase N-terminal domain-containing protein [Phyllobacterium sp. CCNWLW109]|uniref:ketopantoate reductase family protein n=1 Tax=Phyllobacterium sp. CCNWLW109 TaxID=3127479 RepID=UPI003076AFF9
MRIIVFGLGAIGGVVAAKLGLAGHSVVAIARGTQLQAVRRSGLTLLSPQGTETTTFPVYADPKEVIFNNDDMILLAMKGQDTAQALFQLKAAGVVEQPIFCFQNGVANERTALRFFRNVYGVTVMLPADFERPGEVAAYCIPKVGIFDIGRYPAGVDAAVEHLCEVLNSCGFVANARSDVMNSKYRKLLANLENIIETAFSDKQQQADLYRKVRAEAEGVLTAAGIDWDKSEAEARNQMIMTAIPGRDRIGSSTLQSVVRGTGSLETSYLNGEIVLLGRLHNIETPYNSALCHLSEKLADGRLAPKSSEITSLLQNRTARQG